ncbi:accessory gene regulator B family protein [Cohnella lubricantis]|uniref:Accessory gene regulator B family protein n=1 Tax=Cohnella lubricantis TaxID=2163172 RepID=A0A841TGL2_9BACL|nr:accessory gene regulator B family protein [Cohnella lubricantis]MBB6679069.1 accessory gene regulator B family protein [Cohnella lubricantis]MBP2116678.1 accessory gene regulator B [Cohnella lubricantis]
MIEKLSYQIATSIKNAEPDKTPSVDMMKFSLIILIHTAFTALLIIIVSLFTGETLATFEGLLFFMCLRFFSGGYHMHKSSWCTILSIVLMCSAPLFDLNEKIVFILNVLNCIMMVVFAPANIKGYARIPEKYFPLLKVISILIAGSNFMFMSSTIAAVSLFQSVLLLFKNKEGGEKA